MKRLSALFALFLLCAPPARADFVSTPEKTTLVELFTSETRKEAPAANRWMSGLKDSPDLWKKLIPVAMHVDTGQRSKWRDRFVLKDLTARLTAYASKWNVSVPYVPVMYVNGVEWAGWDRDATALPPVKVEKVGILSVSRSGNEVVAIFKPEDKIPENWIAHAALVACEVVSPVEGGENAGKVLTHDFMAVRYSEFPLAIERDRYKKEKWDYRGRTKMSLKDDWRANGMALVVWLTRGDDVRPYQAVGGWVELPIRPVKGKKTKIQTL